MANHFTSQDLRSECAFAGAACQDLLERIVENMPMAIAVLEGPELRYTLVNPGYQNLFEPSTSFVDRTLREVFPTAAADGTEDALRQVLQTERPRTISEFQTSVSRDLQASWSAEVLPLPRPGDEPGRVLLIVSDTTERKRKEAELSESESRFRVMADELPLIVWVHDASGAQEFVNRTFCEFFGVSLAETRGDRWQLLMHPDDADAYREEFLACTRERRSFHGEVRVRTADGSWRWIESWGRPRISPDGAYMGFVGASADITTRKQSDEALRQSEATLSAVIDHLPVGIAVADHDGRILSLNPAAQRTHGFASQDAVLPQLRDYRDQFQLFGADGGLVPADQWPLARALRGERVSNYEGRLRRPDGAERFISYSAVPVQAAANGSSLVVLLIDDVTESRQTQQALRRTLAQSQAIQNQMTEGLVIFDPNGNLLDMNPAALAIHGFESVDSLRRHLDSLGDIFELFDLEGRPLSTDAWPIGRVLRGETFTEYEVRVRARPTGKTWIGSYGGAPVHGNDGELLLAVVTLRDVTTQYESEEALSDAKRRLETVLSATEVGIWYWDVQNNRMRGDRNILKLFDLQETDRDVELDVFVDRLHEADRKHVVAAVERAVAEGDLYEEEYRVVHRNGQVRWIHARGKVETDEQGRAVAFPGVAVDVTQRKQIEDALRQADQRKDEFLATLAHELRNPLAPIQSGIDLLRLTGGEQTRREQTLEMMTRQMSHLIRLVDDLLDVSRISRGKVVLRREPVNLVDALRSTIDTWNASFRGKRTVSMDLPTEPLIVDADPVRLTQIFANLLNNAGKYTEEGGKIAVTAAKEGEHALVSIRDDGIGIDPQGLDQIFGLFNQADAVGSGGLGIGLTLVRSLLVLHGGRVEAHSEGIGHGSEFVVRLPLRETLKVQETAPASSGQTNLLHQRILVVDDNGDAADSLGMLLETLGAEVRTANDGPSALALFEALHPHAVFLDIGMPEMNGYEVAQHIRAHSTGPETQLIAVTGWGQQEDRRRVKQAGFDFHLVKPVALRDIQLVLGKEKP